MKVLFLASWLPTIHDPVYGVFILRHAQAISRLCELSVVHACKDNYLPPGVRKVDIRIEDNVRVVRVYYGKGRTENAPQLVSYALNLRDYMGAMLLGCRRVFDESGMPHLVHVNVAWPVGLVALALKARYKLPYIVSTHSSAFVLRRGGFKEFPFPIRAATYTIFHMASGVSAVSKFLLENLRRQGLVRGRSCVIPNVVKIPNAAPSLRPPPDSPPRFVTVSALEDYQKNISGIIRAFASFVKECPEARLTLIGDGKDREVLERLSAELGLSSHVEFLGSVPSTTIGLKMREMTTFILNSPVETFSVATAEALYCGVPVIVTRCGGPEEFVDETCGRLINVNDEEGLCKAMHFMADKWSEYDPAHLAALVSTRFSEEVVGSAFISFYRDILGMNNAPKGP